MKILKLKSVVFGLLAILAIAIAVTSCEQETTTVKLEDSQTVYDGENVKILEEWLYLEGEVVNSLPPGTKMVKNGEKVTATFPEGVKLLFIDDNGNVARKAASTSYYCHCKSIGNGYSCAITTSLQCIAYSCGGGCERREGSAEKNSGLRAVFVMEDENISLTTDSDNYSNLLFEFNPVLLEVPEYQAKWDEITKFVYGPLYKKSQLDNYKANDNTKFAMVNFLGTRAALPLFNGYSQENYKAPQALSCYCGQDNPDVPGGGECVWLGKACVSTYPPYSCKGCGIKTGGSIH